jgi:hypothetical protein
MILSKNRFTLFGIMRWPDDNTPERGDRSRAGSVSGHPGSSTIAVQHSGSGTLSYDCPFALHKELQLVIDCLQSSHPIVTHFLDNGFVLHKY